MTEHLDADQQNALDDAYSTQREARVRFGGELQDLKTSEECCELTEACSRLTRALIQRLAHYKNGGHRGQVDEETADVLFTVLGLMPADSPSWDILRAKTARLRQKMSEDHG